MAAFIKREKAPDAHKNICHCEFMAFGSVNISSVNNGSVQHCP